MNTCSHLTKKKKKRIGQSHLQGAGNNNILQSPLRGLRCDQMWSHLSREVELETEGQSGHFLCLLEWGPGRGRRGEQAKSGLASAVEVDSSP